jgi:hypothetical protein
MYRLLVAVGLVLAAGAFGRADDVKPIRVELHARALPSPVLRYPLLPELRDLKSGNAVPHYRDAIKAVRDATQALDNPRYYERFDRWRQMPLDRLPRQQMHAVFSVFDPALLKVDEAARHELVDWELTEKLRKMGIGTLLPDVQQMREFAAILSVRVRLALAEGRTDDALRDVQTLMAIARDTAHAPVLICDLVGIAIANIALGQVDEIIQQPGAPNLYWSLADLPQPFVDLRMALQGERIAAYGTFRDMPLSRQDAGKVMTPEQVKMTVKMAEGLSRGEIDIPRPVAAVNFGLDMQRKHEWAKRSLVEAGWPSDAVEKMPHVQVALLHGFLDYEKGLDDARTWINLPYWQASPALVGIEKEHRAYLGIPGPKQPALPIGSLMGPAMTKVLYARTRIERKVAALRCLEALRLYAAAHEGRLPVSLAEVKDVPIPVDPFTGKPFDYEPNGTQRATLSGPSIGFPGRKPIPINALAYEIVMKK